MEEIEEFKDIPGYEGLYQVSNMGKVKSLDRYIETDLIGLFLRKGKILKPGIRCISSLSKSIS